MSENESKQSPSATTAPTGEEDAATKQQQVQFLSDRDVRSLEDQDTPTIWSYVIPHLVGWGVAVLLLFAAISFTRPVWEPILDFIVSFF